MSKNILVISPTPTHPPVAGNRSRINNLMQCLREIGHNVYLFHVKRENGDEDEMRKNWGEKFYSTSYKSPYNKTRRLMRRIKKKLNLESAFSYSIDEWYDKSIDKYIQSISSKVKFDAVIVEYVFFSKALLNFNSNVVKIIDTHDIFTNRHQRYLKEGKTPKWFSTSLREEAKGLSRADVVIAIQQKEAQFFAAITNRRIITIGHMVNLYPLCLENDCTNRILYVGSDNPINVQAATYFLEEIFPRVKQCLPQVEIAFAGRLCDAIDDQKNVVKLGELEDLKSAYDSASLVVNPMRFGTGLKIKTIEALGYAKPVVTTPVGAEGLEAGIGKAFIVAENANTFADHIIDVLTYPALWQSLSDNAYDFASKWNHQCLQELEQLLA